MRQFLTFIRKEFAHVRRDRKTLLMLFGLPVVQIILFGFALTNEIRNSTIAIVDQARDAASRELTGKIAASRYFELAAVLPGPEEMEAAFRRGKIKAAVVFPEGFASDLLHLNKAQVQLILDASDPNTASTIAHYLTAIVGDYQLQLTAADTGIKAGGGAGASAQTGFGTRPYRVLPEIRMLYNPQLKSAPNFVPGVMALILMLVCVMMTSISIVREKESGTMEVLLVSPFRPVLVILSKAVPYLIISLLNLASILLLSIFLLDMPVNGSIPLLLAESTLFIITALSLGLLISTVTDSQQTAMLLSLMGMLLPTILFTGFMFPVENMPVALQVFSNIVPAKWYYLIVKSVMIKGLGFAFVWKETLILSGMTFFFLAVSLRKFKTRLE